MTEDANGIVWTIAENDVEWKMTWGEKYPDKPAEEMIFVSEKALAHMLLNEVIFTNSYWYEKELPEKFQKTISVHVNCNDVFAWGCSDAEDLPHSEIEKLYRMWRKDPSWGASVWCIQQRKEMPQPPVEKRIREQGIWDLDSMGLEQNYYAAQCRKLKP